MVAADHAPPRRLERFRGYDLVQVTGGTQALRRTVLAELEITGTARTTVSVPDAFGAHILKAAAHRADGRDRERHLTDAAVLLACVDPFEQRTSSGSDRSRLLHLREHLADPTASAWLPLPPEARRNGQVALDLLCTEQPVDRRAGSTGPLGITGGIIPLVAMTLRLDDQETEALRRRAALEGRSMQEVARQAVRDYIERTSKRELLDRVLDQELPRYAEALERLGR
ncbi:ribbon-helix-helix protein, CopG family [Geodermatophilus sp. SYSU D00758]